MKAKLNSSELASGLLQLQYVTNGAALGELQGSLSVLLLVLRCIVNLLADRSGSIFLPSCESLRNLALSPTSLLAGFVSIFSD